MRRYFIAACVLLITTLTACAGAPGAETPGGTPEQTGEGGPGLNPTATPTPTPTPGPIAAGGSSGDDASTDEPPPELPGAETSPFEDPPDDLPDFKPPPKDLTPNPDEYGTPREGLWTVYNYAGSVVCPGYIDVDIPESEPQQGTITVIEPDQSFVASGLGGMEEGQTIDITFTADPPVQGRYVGMADISQDGISITIVYHVIVGWPEYLLGFLESNYEVTVPDVGDVFCRVERPFELFYAGEDDE